MLQVYINTPHLHLRYDKNTDALSKYLEKVRNVVVESDEKLPDDPFSLFYEHEEEWFQNLALSRASVSSFVTIYMVLNWILKKFLNDKVTMPN